VSRFRRLYSFATTRFIQTSEPKGHQQLYDSGVVLDLTLLPMTRANAGSNVKSATPAPV
jgi:hypothetical protein